MFDLEEAARLYFILGLICKQGKNLFHVFEQLKLDLTKKKETELGKVQLLFVLSFKGQAACEPLMHRHYKSRHFIKMLLQR